MSAELIPELQRLGQRLAAAREAVGLTQQEQAERLRMGTEQLRALEQGLREELPEPVFVIAQARRVAASLGVDIDADIAALRGNTAFQAKRPAPPPGSGANRGAPGPGATAGPAAPATAPGPGPTPKPGRQQRPRALVLVSAVLLALAGGGIWTQRQLQSPTGSTEANRSAAPDSGMPSAPAAVQANPGPAELVLTSSEPSWLEVRDANGLVLYRGMFNGEQRFPLAGELQVLAGRPDLVLVSRGDGPALPLGPIESVVWRRFSPAPAPAPAPPG